LQAAGAESEGGEMKERMQRAMINQILLAGGYDAHKAMDAAEKAAFKPAPKIRIVKEQTTKTKPCKN
jgi:hypothetical protein